MENQALAQHAYPRSVDTLCQQLDEPLKRSLIHHRVRAARLRVRSRFAAVALCLLAMQVRAQPLVDHHQHLFSPLVAALSPAVRVIGASDLIEFLDDAGIERAIVLSVAYQFGNPNRPAIADEYEQVRAENDWTGQEVARFPSRLRGFCGFNPLRTYALDELARCAEDENLRYGIKLHFGNSDVNLDDPAQIERLSRVFRSANDHGMAVVVHLRPSVTMRRPYGATQARIFLRDILSAAPDVPVQIAHLAGAGGYDDPAIDEALSVFVEAIGRDDPSMANVYFDVSGVAGIGDWTEAKAEKVATRIRELGLGRVFYGSDAAVAGNAPQEAWEKFRSVPLSESEFNAIQSNIAPYAR